MAGCPKPELRVRWRVLRVDQVHVIRHKVLVAGRSQRQAAKELSLFRLTVRKYLQQAVPVRHEAQPRARPEWDAVRADWRPCWRSRRARRGGKQKLTAARLHALLAEDGHAVGLTLVKMAMASGAGSGARSSSR